VYLGDQRAGGIEYLKAAPLGLKLNRFADAMRAKTSVAPGGTSASSSIKIAPFCFRSLTT